MSRSTCPFHYKKELFRTHFLKVSKLYQCTHIDLPTLGCRPVAFVGVPGYILMPSKSAAEHVYTYIKSLSTLTRGDPSQAAEAVGLDFDPGKFLIAPESTTSEALFSFYCFLAGVLQSYALAIPGANGLPTLSPETSKGEMSIHAILSLKLHVTAAFSSGTDSTAALVRWPGPLREMQGDRPSMRLRPHPRRVKNRPASPDQTT